MAPFLLRATLLHIFVVTAAAAAAMTAPIRNIMYLTGQHPVIPDQSLSKPITHVAMAFMTSGTFSREEGNSTWPLFMSVQDARSQLYPGTKVMVAIGGWGDTGFDTAARTEESRSRFARNVAAMVRDTGADGVDIDWEYPGGNGEDYKQTPNDQKSWQIAAYPVFLAAIRAAIGPDKLMSAAVPGLARDMLAFTPETVPAIMQSLDFLNVMAYDLMNRRDSTTEHHTGARLSLAAADAYISRGAPPDRLNLGFAFYTKYFRIAGGPACAAHPVGCPTGPLEDPATGADLGKAGGFAWRDEVPAEVAPSLERALGRGRYDEAGGGYWYYDEGEAIWWTFDTPEAMARKFPLVVEARGLGGVFAWGLGEDAPAFEHLRALNSEVERLRGEVGEKKKKEKEKNKEEL